jgi:GNAT superfamily N-acetyltransferase
MQITTASTEDIPELVELLSVLFSQEAEFRPNADAHVRGLSRIIADADIGVIVVAKQQGRVIGMVNILFTVSTALGEKVGLLEDMVISPARRGEGIGSALLSWSIEHARRLGCARLTLLTDKGNENARRFYERHGFVLSGMVPFRLLLG